MKSHQEEEALKKKISADQLKKQREQDASKSALAKEGDTLIKKETSETGMVGTSGSGCCLCQKANLEKVQRHGSNTHGSLELLLWGSFSPIII